ncbi:putative ATP-dependent RNA helicase spindle-E [Bienertia sinuspersici]
MDLRATKEKLALPIKSAEYRVGVDDFMVYATRSLTSSDGKLRCPCIKCVNNKLLSPDDVNYHLLHFGIMRNYNNWTFHGENKKLRMANANSNRGEINVGNLEQLNTHHTRVEDQQHQSSNSRNQGSDEGSRHEAQEDEGRIYEYVVQGRYYNDDIDINIVQDRCPSDVEKDQWISLVNFWRSEEGKKRSKRGKESLMNAKVKPISTTGTKSHARVREELKKELKKSPTRTQTYLACHTHDNEAEITVYFMAMHLFWSFKLSIPNYFTNDTQNQIKSIVAEQGDKEMNLDDDPVSKVLGKDQYGRVRGLGLGAKPSNFAEISAPPYCTGLNLSSKDERAVFYHLRQLKGWTQRLNKRVKRQDTTIKKLKSKLQSQFGSDFDDSDSNNSGSVSSDFDEDDDFNIHGVDKLYGLIYSACGFVA